MSTCEINKQSNKIMKEKIEKQEEIATGVTSANKGYNFGGGGGTLGWGEAKAKAKHQQEGSTNY